MKSFGYFILFSMISLIFSRSPDLSSVEIIDIDDLNVDYDESYCKKVIDVLIKVVNEIFVYTDISKNPPNKDYYGEIDLESEFKKIPTQNRKYLDFFRDIKKVIAKTKDLHFAFHAKNITGKDIKIDEIYACMPLSLYVKGNSAENAEMFINKFDDCQSFYSEDVIKFIDEHLNKPIKTINNKSPFQFIQEISTDYLDLKSKHGTFTIIIDFFNLFPYTFLPLTKDKLTNIEFTFDDNSIALDYTLFRIPSTEQSYSNQNIGTLFQKLNQKKNVGEIKWKYSTKDKSSFQCLIDDTNKVNVFKQSTFMLFDDTEEIVQKCAEEFYSNSYPIIGIEAKNLGGSDLVCALVQQFTQIKILQRHNEAIKLTELTNKIVKKDKLIDIETCEPIKAFKNITDEYEGGIKHHRTQIFQEINSTKLKEWKEIRKKYYEKKHLKKPTEIIIFADFSSYSATSFVIKGLQETGGAIIVGYRGNPKLKNEPLDASLSPSGGYYLEGTDLDHTLTECGFELKGITTYESFNYTFQASNPLPREFQIIEVDEKIDIYQAYDDSLYEDFIKEAKRIFKEYNEDKKCNPKNDLLLYEPDNNECYNINGIPHAHGGYQCDKTTKTWSNICQPFYCDIGYFYDTYQKKCIEDICTEPKKKSIGTFLYASFLTYIICLIILI